MYTIAKMLPICDIHACFNYKLSVCISPLKSIPYTTPLSSLCKENCHYYTLLDQKQQPRNDDCYLKAKNNKNQIHQV